MSTISSVKGKYYSRNLSIPRPKFLVSRNLRLERKVLAFGGLWGLSWPNNEAHSRKESSGVLPNVWQRIDP